MVGQYGRLLAVSLIKSHFGDLVAKVCECLIRRGTLSLHDTVRFTELSSSQVKNCLLVLIQHNCVQAFSIPKTVGFGGATTVVTQYMALFDNIIHRMRFGKFLAIVGADLGPKCEILLEGLLQHGRLTFDQLVVRATSKQPQATRDDIRANFNKLVHGHYVERCPRAEPFLEPNAETATKPNKRRGSKSDEETPPSIEQQAITAATLSDAERFSGIMGLGAGNVSDVEVPEQNLGVSIGGKRKHDTLDSDADVQAAITENEVLWRANFEKFVHSLKKKACVENIRSRFSLDAGIVLEAMIESNDARRAKEKNSVTSSMDGILEGVREKPGGISMTLEHVRIILEQLGCRLCSEEMGAIYSIDLGGIIEACQNNEAEALVLRRYGKEAYRIFRLLATNGRPCETDNISDTTFVDQKETKGILYKLWDENYVDMQRVTPQGGGQNQLFLWEVNKYVLWENILNDMYHAALNLSQRTAHVMEQDPQESQGAEKGAQKKRWMILQSSLSKLDDGLLLFHDFRH